MVDVFEEVDSQLRSERLTSTARRLLPWIAGLLILSVLAAAAVWGWTRWQADRIARGSDGLEAAMALYKGGDREKAFTALETVIKDGGGAYPVLALQHQGAIRLEQDKVSEAVALFDKAAETAREPVLQDLSRMKSIMALMDTAPLADIESRLAPMLEDDRPFRFEAREALAFARLHAGKTAEARTGFLSLSTSLGVSEDVKSRAASAIALIDSGSAKSVAQVVKSAIALSGSSAPAAPAAPPSAAAQSDVPSSDVSSSDVSSSDAPNSDAQ